MSVINNKASRKGNLFEKGFPSVTILSKISVVLSVSLVVIFACVRPFGSLPRAGFMLSSALLAITLARLFGSYRLSRAVRRARECIAEIEAGNFASRIRSPGSSDIDELAVGINRLAELLELVRAESVRSESARKRLLSDISHDIRTPLTSIIGYVGALRDDIADTGAERDEYVAILDAKSRALKDMVEDIFQLAKLDADEIPMNLERLDLASLVREVLVDFLPEFRAAGIDLVAEIPDAALFVFADRMSCERIVRNLVQNAICHGAGGAYVRVSVAERGATRIDPVVLSVADRGHGIASEDIPRVFTRLFRRESARTGAVGGSGGSGLGLAIVQSLARKNGADVSVTSGPVERSGAFSSHDSPVNETVFEVSFSRIQDDVRKC